MAYLVRLTFLAVSLAGCSRPGLDGPAAQRPAPLRTQKITLNLERPREQTVSFELVQVPAGRITINDATGRAVEHAIKSFWIARYETQWEEYDVFWLGLDLTDEERQAAQIGKYDEWRAQRTGPPYEPPYGGPDAGPALGSHLERYPADCIEFPAAQKYCRWLSKHTSKRFRLPTEAEWEYACRAAGPPLKPDPDALREIAWFKLNAADPPYHAHRIISPFDENYAGPHPVGQKRSNHWGLYDMLGNVGEYVIRDPQDTKGLLAGGSYKDDAKDVHSGAREPFSKDWQKNDPQVPPMNDWLNWSMHHAGFRVVMEE